MALWLIRQGIPLHHGRVRHPQTQGKVGRFYGALERRGQAAGDPVAWLERFRREYDHVQPHQALGMKTPASVWIRSERKYDPLQPAWAYPEGWRTLKVHCQGQLEIRGRK